MESIHWSISNWQVIRDIVPAGLKRNQNYAERGALYKSFLGSPIELGFLFCALPPDSCGISAIINISSDPCSKQLRKAEE